LIEYHSLKLEAKTSYKTYKSTQDLATLLSKHLNQDIDTAISTIKQKILKTKNPVEFIKILKL
jgi:hypothetical protein